MMFNPILDSDQFHNDEIKVLGPAINAINFISVDREAAAMRNLNYIRENIKNRLAYEKSQLTTLV